VSGHGGTRGLCRAGHVTSELGWQAEPISARRSRRACVAYQCVVAAPNLSESLTALRDWVTYDSGGQSRGTSTVLLHVTHSNLKARMFELRLDRHMTIESVKDKLRTHTGTGSAFMHLTLLDENGQVVADMMDEELKLGYFSPVDGWTIHVTDLDPHSLAANGGLEDVSLVKKYEISEEDYMKRENNFRNWKASKQGADPSWTFGREIRDAQERQRMKQDPNYVPEPPKERITDDEHMADLVAAMKAICASRPPPFPALVLWAASLPMIVLAPACRPASTLPQACPRARQA